jgi:cytochrome b6-f complex iron-sulfur subunit
LGRPLTLKEKLAAARNRPSVDEPTPVVSTAAATPAVEAVESASETVSKAPPASAAPELTPAALGRPLTLKEKLAAARGGGAVSAPSGSAAAKPASKPAGAAAPAAKAASTRTLPPIGQTSDPRDLAEHLRRTAADKDKQTKAAAAAKAPAAKAAAPKKVESKVVPPRPGKAAESVPASASLSDASRRLFFKAGFWIAAGWVTFTGGLAALSAMSLRFMFPNVLAEPPSTIKVGFPADFERDQVNERWKGEWGFWVVRSDVLDGEDKIYALSTICTHLGCPPNWLASEQKFKCPCHGSGFYITGVNFEGPAPRPLERYKVSMGDDGQIIVDKSMKFQEELGQWKDPESYIKA